MVSLYGLITSAYVQTFHLGCSHVDRLFVRVLVTSELDKWQQPVKGCRCFETQPMQPRSFFRVCIMVLKMEYNGWTPPNRQPTSLSILEHAM